MSGAISFLDTEQLQSWLAQSQLADDGTETFRRGIAMLEALLKAGLPAETALLSNYPNPFNPETWIPYKLATPAEVAANIYDVTGRMVRVFDVRYQPAGVYQSGGRAVYWNRRNRFGEQVATGVYYYTCGLDSRDGLIERDRRRD